MAIEENRTGTPQDGMRRPRARFWRRLGALLCDAALVLIPLQIIVAILFAQTNGAVQGNFGFQTTFCSSLDKVPDGLQPAPPEGYNSIQDCRLSLFGLATGRQLVVAKVTQTGNSRTAISRNYFLDANGSPKERAFDVTWVAILALLAYMVCMEWRSGETLGKRAAGIRVLDARNPEGRGIPLGRALLRQVAIYAGLLPLVILEIGTVIFVSDVAQLEALVASQSYILLMVVAGLFGLAWTVWIVVSLARKHDPIYDRLAKTAVVIK